MTSVLASLAFVALLYIGLMHVYWALGGRWPGHDEESLVQYVMGGPKGSRLPPHPLVFALGILFLAISLVPLASAGIIPIPNGFGHFRRIALYGTATVFALRGVAGYLEQRINPSPPEAPYVRLNRLVYSPLSLLIAGLLFAVRS